MPDFPHVTLIILTYLRAKEVRACYTALMKYIVYPRDRLQVLIADDASGVLDVLSDMQIAPKRVRGEGSTPPPVSFTSTETNGGFGANYNNAYAQVITPYYFFIESDYLLTRRLDLRVGVALLQSQPDVGILRYRGTAGDRMVLHQTEADISQYLPDYQDGVGLPGRLAYQMLDSNSPSLYVWTNGAHLAHTGRIAAYMPYPTAGRLGELEEKMAHQVKDTMRTGGAPAIAILPDWTAMWFEHTASTYQMTEHDKGWD